MPSSRSVYYDIAFLRVSGCCCSVVPFGFFLLIHSYNILLVDDDDNKTILPNLHDESDGDMATEVHTIIRSVTKLRDDREIHYHHIPFRLFL